MATKTKRPMRNMSAQGKLEAIRRVHAGESKASVARDIGVPESTLRGWCKNEDKISYLSRQSSPETDESLEQPQPKKPKLEELRMQPFDLSVKVNGSSSAFSPDGALDYTKSGPNSPNHPLNMAARMETPKTASQGSDRERNRAELARLSVELGLNRPELLPTVSSAPANQSDLNASLMAQWRAIVMHQQQQQLSLGTIKAASPLDASSMASGNLASVNLASGNLASSNLASGNVASSSGGLLAIAEQDRSGYLPRERQSVHDSVWYWLKSQHPMVNLPQAPPAAHPAVNGAPTSAVTSTTNGMSPTQSSLIWKWYEQALTQQVQQMSAQDPKTILYQQLTKNPQQNVSSPPPQPAAAADQNLENAVDSKCRLDRPGSHKGGRAVLDNLMFNNNNNVKQEPPGEGITMEEAIEHAEQFMTWLESYSNPSITAMHILQFRNLLSNVKGAGERRNCELHTKAKVKRK